jgi:hypothetical protein
MQVAQRFANKNKTTVYLWKLPQCECYDFSENIPIYEYETIKPYKYQVINGLLRDVSKWEG